MQGKEALVVGVPPQGGTALLDHIRRNHSRLLLARSCGEASLILDGRRPHLVLSQISLPDGTADQLLRQLEFAPTNVFFANSLEEKSWWLHVLVNGRNCWWKPKVLSPEEFAGYLRTGISPGSDLHACGPLAPHRSREFFIGGQGKNPQAGAES